MWNTIRGRRTSSGSATLKLGPASPEMGRLSQEMLHRGDVGEFGDRRFQWDEHWTQCASQVEIPVMAAIGEQDGLLSIVPKRPQQVHWCYHQFSKGRNNVGGTCASVSGAKSLFAATSAALAWRGART